MAVLVTNNVAKWVWESATTIQIQEHHPDGAKKRKLHPAVADSANLKHQRLAHCEGIIKRGLHTFLEVGEALREIRDERLYEVSKYGRTFEEYAHNRFGLSRPHAYRYIDAADVQDALSPIGDRIPNESIARALVPLKDKPEKLRETWKRAQEWREQITGESSGHRKAVTAAIVAKEVERALGFPLKSSNGQPVLTKAIDPNCPHANLIEKLHAVSEAIRADKIKVVVIDDLIDDLAQFRNEIEATEHTVQDVVPCVG